MDTALFRAEALQSRERQRWGAVLVAGPLPGRWLSALLATFTAVALAFLALHQYQRKVVVSGVLLPQAGLVELTAPAGARVQALWVTQGQAVSRGQALLELHFDALGDGQDLAAVRATLQGQQSDLQLELQLDVARAWQRQHALQTRLQALHRRQRLGGQVVEQALALLQLRQRAEQASASLYRRRLVAQSDHELRQAQVLEQQGMLDRARLEQQERAAESLDLEQQQAALELESAASQAALRQRLDELQRQLLQLDRERHKVVSAPLAGSIGSLALQPGMTLGAGAPLLSVLPEGGAMVAELEVPSDAIAFVTPGQTVRLRLDAFPYQKFGFLDARVQTVEANAALRGGDGVPRFRVRAALASQFMQAFGHEQALLAGMRLQADITL
ncbi:MAG TPA: HlyD family efflux transporter periplasmic adaptor subunit, partial [Hyphomicrobiales bacterium]|nr:HlyD family efflux transporter periplasmic adaptor subunit [Hyphomicrobiales bacterium]